MFLFGGEPWLFGANPMLLAGLPQTTPNKSPLPPTFPQRNLCPASAEQPGMAGGAWPSLEVLTCSSCCSSSVFGSCSELL